MGADVLERLRSGEGLADLPASVVVAHPDDEVIGVGGRLPRLKRAHVVYATDGAPADLADAVRAGFRSREAYRDARAREAEAGLAVAGVPPARIVRLVFADQRASLDMAALTQAVLATLRHLRPEVVLTHPFENGHPDHDAVALAVHLAIRKLLADAGEPVPELIEFASYHDPDGSGRLAVQEFLPADTPAILVELDEREQALKRRLLACHATQAAILSRFPVDRERYRLAPAYDFLAPPHPWRPLYETWFDTMTRERWQGLAAAALAAFGLEGRL